MDFETLPYADMTGYERQAWARLSAPAEEVDDGLEADTGDDEPSLIARTRERAVAIAAGTTEKAKEAWEQVPGNDQIETQVARAIDGAFRAYLDLIAKSINEEDIRDEVAEAAKATLADLEQIRDLDLKHVHAVMPDLGRWRASVAGLHGAAAGFVAGGATAAGATSGGMGALPSAGLFALTMTADAAGVISSSLQASGLISAYHGFPPVDGGGQHEVLRLQAAVAAAGGAKMALLKQVQELAMALAARRSIAELSTHALYRSLRHLFGWLTLSTAKRSIAKGVPIAGVVLGGGWNYGTLRRGIRSAEDYYDLRFLFDKYGSDQMIEMHDDTLLLEEPDDEEVVGEILARLDELDVEDDPWDASE